MNNNEKNKPTFWGPSKVTFLIIVIFSLISGLVSGRISMGLLANSDYLFGYMLGRVLVGPAIVTLFLLCIIYMFRIVSWKMSR